MLSGFCAFILSLLDGSFAAMFNEGWGTVVSVSVTGAFIVYSLNKERGGHHV